MRQSACLVVNRLTQSQVITLFLSLIARRWSGVRLSDGPDIKLFVLVGWVRSFLSVAWPTGVQLLGFFCSSIPAVLFNTPGISRCRSQHVVSVESSSLFHHSIHLWFICFPWWSIDELENLHADRTSNYLRWLNHLKRYNFTFCSIFEQ